MNHYLRVCTVLVAGLTHFGIGELPAADNPASPDRPNILLILADDLGYSDLGCYGGEIDTPHIDELAGHGVRFTQLYNSARCCPSRASLMTGLYPSQAGIGDFTTAEPSKTRGPGYLGRLNEQCVTLAEALKPAGYGCYYVGKWHMHPETGPIKRGFDEFYGYTRGHSHDQYDADYYIRLPEGRAKEIDPPRDEFYATDVFNEYALEFIRQGQKSDKPWFLFLGHSSPHFPVQAPAERADKYEKTYLRGWDVLRKERFARMQKLGLIDGDHWKLTPRSIVPVDRPDIANGYPGKPNPAWDSLEPPRQRDLARRMAVFAAMVETIDQGVGRIVDHLKSTGDLDDTLILFLSDNGACYEWGPYGFDGRSRRGITTLRTGDELRDVGGPGTHQSYGSGWANLGNTPLRLYKHFTHEGGISTPFIVHWPAGIGRPDKWVRDPAHVMDVMPTLLEAAGAEYPAKLDDRAVLPLEGTSLLPAMRGNPLEERSIGFDHQGAHALRKGDWKLVWSKRMPREIEWELYNLAEDRCETNDLADQLPQRVKAMAAEWERWARRVNVIYETAAEETEPESPQIANRTLTITGHVESGDKTGVIVAQGGRAHGYAVHLLEGKPAFDVRIRGNVTRLVSEKPAPKEFGFEAKLTANSMTLAIDGKAVAKGSSPGLIPLQPKDPLNVGRDELSAAGDYTPPNPLQGNVSKLKVKVEKPTRPFQSKLITRWGERVTADNAWTEYPRPQMRRDQWQNLNGKWDYTITPIKQKEFPDKWAGKILVPFCLESKLGGVQRLLHGTEALWYRREFAASPTSERRTLLNFEAVDYRCEVFVNGQSVGTHQGGHTPFSFDVTDALREGANELVVRVEDATEGWQLRGKQVLNPRGIWYTRVSGIWQTVWLEQVPSRFIQDLKIATDAEAGSITVRPVIEGDGDAAVRVTVSDGDTQVAHAEGDEKTVTLTIPDAKLWSPGSPHLYDISVALLDAGGKPVDTVQSYAGIRDVGKTRDENGHWRFTLNGKPIFHWGPLDQGWWPDGLLTPPSDEAMRFEIDWLKQAGFNMIRKHIKIEPRRYYYHCDRLGMMVWQDHVSGGEQPPWTRLKPNPVDAQWPDAQHEEFMRELERMISALENHPSIVCWVPFNERWGQHRTLEVGKWVVERDRSRLVNVASGGNFWPVGDVVDAHRYPHPGFPFEQGKGGRFDDYIKVMGEFGGHGYPVKGHLWDSNRRNWGYGGLPQNEAEYKERYVTSLKMLNALRGKGIAGGVYTQTTDVEGEINGLMTYDRKVVKIPAKELAELHEILFQEAPASDNGDSVSDANRSQPHIVVYLSDDHSQFDSSLYGNDNIPTPNFEKLAADGMTFTHAFVASPSCAPSRAALLTGLMPARNGAEANHTRPREGTHCLIQDLQAAGYEVAAFGKVAHGRFRTEFGFDHLGRGRRIPQLRDEVARYLAARETDKPLCLFVGTTNPHVPWAPESSFDPAKVEFPPHHLDTPATRVHRAAYYQEIKDLDRFMGTLRGLAAKHLGENTVFVHTSDHGSQWPFGKWNLYDYGTRVPFIAAWPGEIEPGVTSNAMISWVDLLPTLIELGGGTVPDGLDGCSFTAVLRGQRGSHRDAIFTTHTGDGTKNIYPIRSVRTREWKLIHNLHPEFAHTNHSDLDRKPLAGAYWTEWAALARKDDRARRIVDRYFKRPEWELYHVKTDKWEQKNLAGDSAHAETLARLKKQLAGWMREQGDQQLVHSEPRRLDEPERWHPDYFEPQTTPGKRE